MTLGIVIISKHGTWQTSDTRLFDARTRRPEADRSTKQFAVVTRDGAALITYAGVGRLASGAHVSDLMVDLLRGEMRTLDETSAALSAFATHEIAAVAAAMPAGLHMHVFNVAGHRGAEPYMAEIRNVDAERQGSTLRFTLRKDFTWLSVPVPDEGFVGIVGAYDYVSQDDRQLLQRIEGRKPARSRDFLQVLASITKRAAQRVPDYISEECWGWYLAPDGQQPEAPVPFPSGSSLPDSSAPRTLTMGLDLGAAMQELVAAMGGTFLPADEFGEAAIQGMRQAVRVQVGQRVRDTVTGQLGHVAEDPVAGGEFNDIKIRWDNRSVEIVHRGRIQVVSPQT